MSLADVVALPVVRVDSLYFTGRLNKRWYSYLLADEPERLVVVRANGSPLWSSKGHFWNPPGPALEIYPRNEWFNIYYIFTNAGELDYYYINVALPPTLEGGVLSFVDIDLDLSVSTDFSHVIHDEDEFLDHCDLWLYPRDLCERARATLDDLLDKVRLRDPLFDEWQRYWPLVPSHFVNSEAAAMVPPQDEVVPAPGSTG
jgi:hypothetical protein